MVENVGPTKRGITSKFSQKKKQDLLRPSHSNSSLNKQSKPATQISPSLTPSTLTSNPSQSNARSRAQRYVFLHFLALGSASEDIISKKTGITGQDLRAILQSLGDKTGNGKEWQLTPRRFKELDVWQFQYNSQEERQTAIDNAIHAFDRQRIDPKDLIWQSLLPKEERGKGKMLSKLQIKAQPHLSKIPADHRKVLGDSLGSHSMVRTPSASDSTKVKTTVSISDIDRSTKSPMPSAKKRKVSEKSADGPGSNKSSSKKGLTNSKFKSSEIVSDSESDLANKTTGPSAGKMTTTSESVKTGNKRKRFDEKDDHQAISEVVKKPSENAALPDIKKASTPLHVTPLASKVPASVTQKIKANKTDSASLGIKRSADLAFQSTKGQTSTDGLKSRLERSTIDNKKAAVSAVSTDKKGHTSDMPATTRRAAKDGNLRSSTANAGSMTDLQAKSTMNITKPPQSLQNAESKHNPSGPTTFFSVQNKKSPNKNSPPRPESRMKIRTVVKTSTVPSSSAKVLHSINRRTTSDAANSSGSQGSLPSFKRYNPPAGSPNTASSLSEPPSSPMVGSGASNTSANSVGIDNFTEKLKSNSSWVRKNDETAAASLPRLSATQSSKQTPSLSELGFLAIRLRDEWLELSMKGSEMQTISAEHKEKTWRAFRHYKYVTREADVEGQVHSMLAKSGGRLGSLSSEHWRRKASELEPKYFELYDHISEKSSDADKQTLWAAHLELENVQKLYHATLDAESKEKIEFITNSVEVDPFDPLSRQQTLDMYEKLYKDYQAWLKYQDFMRSEGSYPFLSDEVLLREQLMFESVCVMRKKIISGLIKIGRDFHHGPQGLVHSGKGQPALLTKEEARVGAWKCRNDYIKWSLKKEDLFEHFGDATPAHFRKVLDELESIGEEKELVIRSMALEYGKEDRAYMGYVDLEIFYERDGASNGKTA